MEIGLAICFSGIVALMISMWSYEKRIEKEIKAQRKHIDERLKEVYDGMNAFFSAMQDIDRDNREKLEAVILLIMDKVKEEK